jgi:hypothetical protein
LTATSAA